MKWVEVVVKTCHEKEDKVADILYQAGALGLAIEDPRDFLELSSNKKAWNYVDSNLMSLDEDVLILKAYFSEAEDTEKIVDFIRKRVIEEPLESEGEAYGEVTLNLVDDQDFAEAWKQYYKPLRIGDRIIIKPSWETYDEEPGDLVIELDPGMAFGTGTHETTSMCIEALEGLVKENDHIYDIGCGSGILGITAAKLGAERVIGIDIDPVCIEVSKENIEMNGVEDIVQVYLGDLFDVVDGKADIIVSNIIAEVIIDMIDDLNNYLEEDGFFIASGIILSKVGLVEEKLKAKGMKVLETKRLGEWACIVAQK